MRFTNLVRKVSNFSPASIALPEIRVCKCSERSPSGALSDPSGKENNLSDIIQFYLSFLPARHKKGNPRPGLQAGPNSLELMGVWLQLMQCCIIIKCNTVR